jgi:hypothetical protein
MTRIMRAPLAAQNASHLNSLAAFRWTLDLARVHLR